MKTLIIGGIAGYLMGEKIVSKMTTKIEEKLKLGLGVGEYAGIGGAIVYFVKPLPEGANNIVSGFLLGTAIASLSA